MNKILTLIFALSVFASAATLTFNGALSTDANNPGNYVGPPASIESTDDIVIDGTASVAWIMSANLSVQTVTSTSAFGQAVNIGTYTLTVTAPCSFSHTGALTVGDGGRIAVNGNDVSIHYDAGLASITSGKLQHSWTGTGGSIDQDKATVLGPIIVQLNSYLHWSGAVENFQVADVAVGLNPVELKAGAALKVTGTTGYFRIYGLLPHIKMTATSACTLNTITNAWLGTYNQDIEWGLIKLRGDFGYVRLQALGVGASEDYKMTAAFDVDTHDIQWEPLSSFPVDQRLDFNDQNVTFGDLRITRSTAVTQDTLKLYAGNGNILCKSFRSTATAGTQSVPSFVYMEGSKWGIDDSMILDRAGMTFDAGTSIDTFSDTSKLTSNSNRLHKIVVNSFLTGTDRLWVDTAIVPGTLATGGAGQDTVSMYFDVDGTLDMSGDTIQATNMDIASGSTLTIDSLSILRIADGGTVRMGGKNLPRSVMDGSVSWYDGGTWASLSYGVDGDTARLEAAKKFTVTAIDTADWNGSGSNLNYMFTPVLNTLCTLKTPTAYVSKMYLGGITGDSLDAAFSRGNKSRSDNN